MLWVAAPASAQEAGSPDGVLVVDFLPDDPAQLADARRLHDAVEWRLREDHAVLPMDDVPPFLAYDAHVYALACPTGQYVDCAFSLGARSGMSWVVGAELLGGDEFGRLLRVSILDVQAATLRLVVDLTWDGTNEAALARGVADLLHAVQTGAADTVDLRLDPLAGDTEAIDAASMEAAADELGALEQDEGEVERGEQTLAARRRVTRADLARWEGQDDPPWARVHLTEDAWRRWQNSGKTLSAWRDMSRGRMGELLLGGTAFTLAQGPWTQVYEGWYAIDAVNLEMSEQFVMQDQARGLRKAWELSVGGGVAPWLDVSLFGGSVVGGFRYRVQRVVEGEEPRPVDPSEKAVPSWVVGGRITFAPMPTFPARPTLGAGVEAWFGTPREKVLEVPAGLASLPRNRMILLGLHPGVEVTAGRWIFLWARMDLGIPLSGRVAQERSAGGALLEGHPSADASDDGLSLGGGLGATLRLRLRPKWHPGR